VSFLFGARIVFALLFVIVTYLTVTPNPEDTKASLDFTRWLAVTLFGDAALGDKLGHFLAYAVLGASAALARIRIAGSAAASIAALALYGAALEGVQALGGVRDPELLDALADALGALCGYLAAVLLIGAGRPRASA
jgi:hypothetical protein